MSRTQPQDQSGRRSDSGEGQADYVEHYHGERNHKGLDNRLISGPPVITMTSRVRCRPRLGGLLNFYERAA